VTEGAITKEVADFLTRYIGSIAQLELLLLLKRHEERHWDADSIVREVHVDHDWAMARLKEFARAGIAREEATRTFRYAPKNGKLRSAVDAVAQLYAERRVAVVDFIYAKPLTNLRVFAESFRIRRRNTNGNDRNG
jgi:hypothetical protein